MILLLKYLNYAAILFYTKSKGVINMTEQELKQYLDAFKNELVILINKQLSKPAKQLLTVREAAEYLGVSYNTFQKFRYEGLKIFEVDGIKRIYKHELDKFIEDNCY